MKEWIIKVNDLLIYLVFGLLACFSAIMLTSGSIIPALIFFVVGFILLSLLSGAWIVLSSICEQSAKQNILLEKILKEQMKSPLDGCKTHL